MHRKKIDISTVVAGQRLGIKEIDDGVWLISFMRYDLGCIDNLFGMRLLPMSPI